MTKRNNNSQRNVSTQTGEGLAGSGNLVFLIAGGLIGAAAALLFAPKAGSDLRGDISEVARKGYDGALDLSGKVKDQTTNLVQTIKEKGSGLVDAASQKLGTSTGETAGNALDEAAGTAGDVLSLDETTEGGTGMSATNAA